jgi:two-component system nitrate/nitrite response regulator NarL
MNNIKLAIVDDHPLFREGVVAILGSEPGIEIVGQGSSAADAIRLASELLPDIILLDINMRGGGVYAAKTIAQAYPVVKIVMLTASDDEDDVLTALKGGAKAYVLKGVATRELVGVLNAVQDGQGYVTPSLAANILAEKKSRDTGEDDSTLEGSLEGLTSRERQILALIAGGYSNKEIGQQVTLAEKSVKHYVTNILQKLQVQNRVQAALMAQKARLTKE